MTSVLCLLDSPLMRGVVLFFLGVLSPQLAWSQPQVANSIKVVVGGQKIITQWDVDREASRSRMNPALAQKKLEQDALLVVNIKGQKGYVEPAGLGELLLKGEIKNRYGKDRNNMIATLRIQGKTVQQREAELVDDWLLRRAERTVRQAVQVSPAAIKKYYRENPDLNNKGVTADVYAIRIARDEGGMSLAKVQQLKNGIKSLADFKKLAVSRKVSNGGHKGLIHKDDQNEFNDEVAAEVFVLEEKEVGLAFDDQAYYLLYLERRWDKYEIPITQVHKLIEARLAQELFEQQMVRKLERLRNEIHVYYPAISLLLKN